MINEHRSRIARSIGFGLAVAMGVAWQARAQTNDPDSWTPDQGQIARVDALAVRSSLPAGFGPLDGYVRYYWGTRRDGHRLIEGTLLAPAIAPAHDTGVHVVAETDAPDFSGSGCSVFNVTFDVASNRLTYSACNFELPKPPPKPKH